jgi:hypothetical protein
VALPAGSQTIRWDYIKDVSLSMGQDRAWVDQVQFVLGAGTVLLSPSNAVHASSSSSGTVNVTAASNFTWAVFNTNSWISMMSGTNGTGNGAVNYTVAANTNLPVRSGNIQIGDKNFLVIQSGYTNPPPPATNCTISILPSSRTHGYGRVTNTVMVTATNNCGWNVLNTNSWVSISNPNSSGSGAMVYSLTANTNLLSRSGNVIIGGRTFFLTQSGPPKLQFVNRPGTNAMLSVQGSQGSYVVECSEDLIHWIPISTNSPPSTLTDVPVSNTPRRFYRTLEIP